MPPKKVKKSKPKRIPHANETPLKDKQPGHGAVERAKNHMWSEKSNSSSQYQIASSTGLNRSKYKATSTIKIGAIGRGGGLSIKKKSPSMIPAVEPRPIHGDISETDVERANPDSDFFSTPSIQQK